MCTAQVLAVQVLAALLLAGCGGQPAPRDASAVDAIRRDPHQVVAEVARIRGLPDVRRTRILFDDDETFRKALYEKARRDGIGPTDGDSQAFALAFEFPPVNARAGSSAEDVIEEQVIAFYDVHTHTVHMRLSSLEDNDADDIVAVLAHELGHSLQSQHFEYPDLADVELEDRRLALNAVLEGDSMLLMIAHAAERHRVPVNRALVRVATTFAEREFRRYSKAAGVDDVLSQAPPLLRERLTFPYMGGMTFLSALYRAGGFELVNRVYAHPPDTTEQILHPELYLAGEGAVPVDTPPAPEGTEALVSGRVGELQTRIILSYCLSTERSAAAAAGWGGDAYTVAAEGKLGALLWSTFWDTERDAEEFEAALREYVQCTRARSGNHLMLPPDLIRREGRKVALVRGLGAKRAQAALAGLFGLVGEPAVARAPFGAITIPPLRQAAPFRPPYVNQRHYVNEQLGLVARVPPGFEAEVQDATTVVMTRGGASPAVAVIGISDRIASMRTVDEVHGELAGELQRVLGEAKLNYAGGRDVSLGEIGQGVERRWVVEGSAAGLKAIVIPICDGTGSVVLWGLWADGNGLDVVDWWLGHLRRTNAHEPPICAELNP